MIKEGAGEIMEIKIKINGARIRYFYKVGISESSSEMDLSADALLLFSDMLRRCSVHRERDFEKRREMMWIKSMAEEMNATTSDEKKP